MLGLDKLGADKLLLQLEEKQFINPRYRFVKENNELKLLGTGGFSYVYEMYDLLAPENHYAVKIIGLGAQNIDEQLIIETTQIQYCLSEQSENIMRVIALWTMKIQLDESGNINAITGANQEGYEEAEGVLLEVILMEKLDNVLAKDKYGNIELLRAELATEEGIISFIKNIGRALGAVHNNGFLHRDIKLENIFWDPKSKQYKLGDFGIARYIGDGDAETVVFTDGYGAPEIERQLAGSYNLTADIYSFGITLFLLLNNLKFPASDGYYANIVQYSKDFIVPAPANSSPEIARIIRKMCSYHVKDRYQSVEEVLMDIGRIDGSYENSGFTADDELVTETYREEVAQTQTYYDSVSGEEQCQIEDSPKEIRYWRKEDTNLNREERKKKKQSENESYTSSSIWRMIFTALLTLLFLKVYSMDAAYILRCEFWILPIALFVESILQRVKEFHVAFAFLTVGTALLSMHYVGIDVPQIAAIVVVLIGIPAITAGFSIGMGLWIAHTLTGKLAWLSFFDRCDLGWIVLILLGTIIQSYIFYRADCRRASYYEIFFVDWIMDKIWCFMIISGIIVMIAGIFNVIEIPEIIKRLHLVRTGIGLYFVEIFYLWYYELLFDRENETDESLDE